MYFGFPFRPQQASTVSVAWDHLFYFLTAVAIFFSVLIFVAIFYLAIKYRRRSADELPPPTRENLPLEITWTIVPLALTVVMFVWASSLFIRDSRPPAASTEIFVVGKQWMWKIQHPEGPREINELHVPVNQPIELTMTSEDVIHDFGVPAFRIKKDVIPGQYTTEWFEATKTGRFHLFCDQYCGMGHSSMIGWIIVMPPDAYERWLDSQMKVEPMSAAGSRLFSQLGCGTCHGPGQVAKAPSLAGLAGATVKLQNGQTVVADDAYLRGAILTPRQVAGFPAVMPTFQGQVSEDEVLQLIAYIKSLESPQGSKGKFQ
ncbi:MAG TPA: cytochrome c oxidase subunit II [Terriglobia bacterium]|nr:cytochrome c oxidase subunit II [Terriglobia bacterium]